MCPLLWVHYKYYEKEDYKYYAKCTCEGCEYEEFAWEIEAERVDLSTPTSEGPIPIRAHGEIKIII